MNAARTNFTTFSTVSTEVPEPFHTELGDPQETAVKPRPSHNQKKVQNIHARVRSTVVSSDTY